MSFKYAIPQIKEALAKNNVVLVIAPLNDFGKFNIELIKEISGENTLYAAFRKPAAVLLNELKQEGVECKKFFFIDVVSKNAGFDGDKEKNVFLADPADCDMIEQVLSTALEKKFSYFVLDSLNAMLSHNVKKEKEVIRCLSNSINEARKGKTACIIFAAKNEAHANAIQEISAFVDKVFELK